MACIVRDAKVDRLPQLLSIVRGHISFIGPPLVARDQLDDFDARPGLFGMSKAYCSGMGDVRRRAALERYYVRRWSVWLDLALLGKAVVALKSTDLSDDILSRFQQGVPRFRS